MKTLHFMVSDLIGKAPTETNVVMFGMKKYCYVKIYQKYMWEMKRA
jgi:hypothetical protein